MWSLKKFTSAYLFQIAREKSCDYLLMIYVKKKYDIVYHNYTEASAHIKCKNNLFKPCIPSKQLRTIKIVIYKDILTSQGAEKSKTG